MLNALLPVTRALQPRAAPVVIDHSPSACGTFLRGTSKVAGHSPRGVIRGRDVERAVFDDATRPEVLAGFLRGTLSIERRTYPRQVVTSRASRGS